ncbi:MAG: hypothetical protein WCW67_05170 [Candidatus Margulisiibacteriota bacterium]|jgi:hypothetical protein
MIGRLQAQQYIPAYMRAKSACVNLARRPDLQVYPDGKIPFSTANLRGTFELFPSFKLPLGCLKQKAIPAIKANLECVTTAAECGLAVQIGEEADFLTLHRLLRRRHGVDCPPDFPVKILDIQAFSPFLSFELWLSNQTGNKASSILGIGGVFDRSDRVFRGTNVYDLFKRTGEGILSGEPGNYRADLDFYLMPNSHCREILLFQLTVTISEQNFEPVF